MAKDINTLSSNKSARNTNTFTRLRNKLSTKKKTPESPITNENNNVCSELLRVFNYFDENQDGKISPEELQSCVRTMGREITLKEAEAAVMSSDLDGDGLLGFEEFEWLMKSGDKDSELKEAFEMYVMEGSGGFITPVSLKRMLSRLGDSRSVEACEAMISKFDVNGDGVLSFDEFRTMMA